jgi:Predicted amino acid aldolase or racemase
LSKKGVQLYMDFETPCLIIDYEKMKRNIDKMAMLVKRSGCKLRPHVKTHKIPEIAKIQIHAGACGITVAKVSEAEVMASSGIKDIFIAYPIIGDGKIQRLLKLNESIRLIIGVDSLAGARALSEAALEKGQVIEVRLEVDTGLRRTGVPYDKAMYFAKEISTYKGIRLSGIYTFKGLVYKGNATLDREKAGLEEGHLMVALGKILRKEGMAIEDISVGSTPTAVYAANVPGVTEVRPGTYVFNDGMQVSLGICTLDECAAGILATVVSISDKHAVIDGGNKTFSTDAIPDTFPYYFKGYGRITRDEGLILERLSEEHGIVGIGDYTGVLDIGDRLFIIPNHICTTVNLHDRAYIVKDGMIDRKLVIAARGKVY